MFKIENKVKWTSQAQGFSKEKVGEVVQIVPPGDRPNKERFMDLYKGPGVGIGRNHVTYVVRVGNRHYWPRVKHLQLV
jgi:hypothetical protein